MRSLTLPIVISCIMVLCFQLDVTAQQAHILSQRSQSEIIDQWLGDRLDTIVPDLMRREKIDMWVLVAREYNEDPVLLTMLPSTWHAARRRTILVFFDPGNDQPLERLAVARYSVGRFFSSAWNPDEEPNQWQRLADIIAERNPSRIALNYSDHFGLADGIAYTDFTQLRDHLAPQYANRIVSAENLAIGWLETRSQAEINTYRQINRIAHQIVEEGLSENVITPGVTTTADVQWWYRERIKELKLDEWFHPSVSIQRSEAAEHTGDFSGPAASDVIQPGDLLHMDFGITYLRLNTDTQRMAYVLRPGETEIPKGLVDALKVGNRLQDILTGEFKTGRTGNEILLGALNTASAEGIKATIYTHPIGFHGHAAGPTIGLWDQQGGVPGQGDYPLYPNTAHSIELNAEVFIPEWNRSVRIMLEEDAIFDGTKTWYTDGRMTELYTIPRNPKK
ncbi:MAG TPA: Xaa-Pro aminopeptidase [Bacteroidetes bacterium]|nr:Xaa-Pro aminopeptidase [Bacteroidota bacterium]